MDLTIIAAIALFGLIGILLLRSVINFIAARKYGVYIRATMKLNDVKDFIRSVGKPVIEVFERRDTNQVVILWKRQYSLKDYPSVEVYVDKVSSKPVRIIVRDSNNNVVKDENLS